MDQAVRHAPVQDPPVFRQRLCDHFGREPTSLPIVSEQFKRTDHPNLHLALTAYLAVEGRSFELYGVSVANDHMGMRLAQLAQDETNEWVQPKEASVEYANVALHDDQVLACVQRGLYVIHDGAQHLAVLLSGPSHDGFPRGLSLEVMAIERATAEAFLATIRRTMRQRNVYRGQIISLEPGGHGDLQVHFHHLPHIERDAIILAALWPTRHRQDAHGHVPGAPNAGSDNHPADRAGDWINRAVVCVGSAAPASHGHS
jgi:hypothetical protein